MSKIKVPKETLIDASLGIGQIEDRIVDHRRWSVTHEMVFEYEGKLYRSTYSQGATEYQDEQPYEYEDTMVEVEEVKAVEKTVTVYEPA